MIIIFNTFLVKKFLKNGFVHKSFNCVSIEHTEFTLNFHCVYQFNKVNPPFVSMCQSEFPMCLTLTK